MLNTPETVPFRLTRDVVDGMGVAGVEGVFRHSCEHTLRVLRARREALITVLEVRGLGERGITSRGHGLEVRVLDE